MSRAPQSGDVRVRGLGGVGGAARVQGEGRNTRGPSAPPSSRYRDSYKPMTKASRAQRASEGIVIVPSLATNNARGAKGPCGGPVGATTCANCSADSRMSGPLWVRAHRRVYFLQRWPSLRAMHLRCRRAVDRCDGDIRDKPAGSHYPPIPSSWRGDLAASVHQQRVNQHHGIQSTERFGVGTDPENDGFTKELTRADVAAVVRGSGCRGPENGRYANRETALMFPIVSKSTWVSPQSARRISSREMTSAGLEASSSSSGGGCRWILIRRPSSHSSAWPA